MKLNLRTHLDIVKAKTMKEVGSQKIRAVKNGDCHGEMEHLDIWANFDIPESKIMGDVSI